MVNEVSAGTTMAADIRDWDVKPPDEYFEQLARVSKNQIIFGANYFNMPPTRCFIVWRKSNIPLEGFSMSPVEYAWTSFFQNAAMFECYSSGGSGANRAFIQRKSLLLFTNGFFQSTQSRVTKYLIHTWVRVQAESRRMIWALTLLVMR